MESTAQYWRPVWMALEDEFSLTLTQARATRAPRGRKQDLADARRIAKRLLADDLTLVREGLAALCGTQPNLRITGQCSQGAVALQMIEEQKPDIAVRSLPVRNFHSADPG